MDKRLAQHLERLGQADRILRDHGEDPQPFLLISSFGPSVTVKHPAWDPSWATPVAEDIDDLEEFGYLRIDPAGNAKRLFSLTVKGREQAAVLTEPQRSYANGRAPDLHRVLDWLFERSSSAPQLFELPSRLIDEAVSSGLIEMTGRDAFAQRLLDLRDGGYLLGDIPDFEQASAEHRIGLSDGLRLSMKAHDRAKTGNGNTVNFYGDVIASQVAAGDITNYATFGELLDSAAAEIVELDDVEDADRQEALTLISTLRGKAIAAADDLLTGAGGALLAMVLGQLLGLPPTA